MSAWFNDCIAKHSILLQPVRRFEFSSRRPLAPPSIKQAVGDPTGSGEAALLRRQRRATRTGAALHQVGAVLDVGAAVGEQVIEFVRECNTGIVDIAHQPQAVCKPRPAAGIAKAEGLAGKLCLHPRIAREYDRRVPGIGGCEQRMRAAGGQVAQVIGAAKGA